MKKLLPIVLLLAVAASLIFAAGAGARPFSPAEVAPPETCPNQTDPGLSAAEQAEVMLCMTNYARSVNGLAGSTALGVGLLIAGAAAGGATQIVLWVLALALDMDCSPSPPLRQAAEVLRRRLDIKPPPQLQLLAIGGGPDRQDQTSARRQLFEQRGRPGGEAFGRRGHGCGLGCAPS